MTLDVTIERLCPHSLSFREQHLAGYEPNAGLAGMMQLSRRSDRVPVARLISGFSTRINHDG
jgi:hypothetical protein